MFTQSHKGHRGTAGLWDSEEGAEIREGGQPCSHRATEHTARRSRNQRSRATKNTRSHKRGALNIREGAKGVAALRRYGMMVL